MVSRRNLHTIEEMKVWLQAFGYSDAIKDATINAILREFVMSKVSCDEMRNMDMIVELLRPQLEVTTKDIEHFRKQPILTYSWTSQACRARAARKAKMIYLSWTSQATRSSGTDIIKIRLCYFPSLREQ